MRARCFSLLWGRRFGNRPATSDGQRKDRVRQPARDGRRRLGGVVNADLLPDVGPQAGPGDGKRSLCLLGVHGQQRLAEHHLVTSSSSHPDTKEEQDHQREHEPAPGVVDDLGPLGAGGTPAVARAGPAQFLFLNGIPTVHS